MKVIIINGSMGIGKTKVGKYIAENNKGTAFIDGDWCLVDNYRKCSVWQMVVLVWLMDNQWVY